MATRKAKVTTKDVGAFISHIKAMTTYQVGDIFYYRRTQDGGVFEGRVVSTSISLREHLGEPVLDFQYMVELKGAASLIALRCHEMKRSLEDAFR